MTSVPIPSPCISVCYLDRMKNLCVGCYRTAAEIGEWPRAGNGRRAEILEECRARREEAIRLSRSPAGPSRSTP